MRAGCGILALALLCSLPVDAASKRDMHQRAAFMKMHPCPSTGKARGACPGYVVDHVVALCAGGKDSPTNMQWQTVEAGKLKDRDERRLCASHRRGRRT